MTVIDIGCIDDAPENWNWVRDIHDLAAADRDISKNAAADPGAAFLLIRARNDDGKWRYLLQKRSDDTPNSPETWGLPGGNLHPGEDTWDGAVREATEEMGPLPRLGHVMEMENDGATTYVVEAPDTFTPDVAGGETPEESSGYGWFGRKEIPDLDLHPKFRDTWDSVDWKDLGKQPATAGKVEKRYNPSEARDPHGRWTRDPGMVFVGTGDLPERDTGMSVTHPELGHGRVSDVGLDPDEPQIHVDVRFDNGEKRRYEYHDPGKIPAGQFADPGLNPRSVLSKPEPPVTFDHTASEAIKRLNAAIARQPRRAPELDPEPFDEQKKDWFSYGPLSEIAQAIRSYVSPDSTINKDLRKAGESGPLTHEMLLGGDDRIQAGEDDVISTLDNELAKEHLTKPAVVYRGFTATEDRLSKMTPGTSYTDHAYTSTASDPKWAEKFAVLRAFGEVPRSFLPLVKAHGGKPVIMKITVPEGGHLIKGESDLSEYILPRDTDFKITSISADGSLIDAEVTNPDPPSLPKLKSRDEVIHEISDRVSREIESRSRKNPAAAKAGKQTTPAQVMRLAGTEDELDFGDEDKASKALQADLLKTGPEGYIHGWVCVRPPCGSAGDEVSHPDHGTGHITSIDPMDDTRHASFSDGYTGILGRPKFSKDYDDDYVYAAPSMQSEEGAFGDQEIGTEVKHPDLGHGTVTGVKASNLEPNVDYAHLKFDDGSERDVEVYGGDIGFTRGIHPRPHDPDLGSDLPEGPYGSIDDPEIEKHSAVLDAYADKDMNADLSKYLRSGSGDNPGLDQMANDLDGAVNVFKAASPVTMYRGIALTPGLKEKLTPGTTFTDKNFTSVSSSSEVAHAFAGMRVTGKWEGRIPSVPAAEPGSIPADIEISIPAGTHMAPTDMTDLGEYVLPRNTKFHVDSVSGSHYKLSVMP